MVERLRENEPTGEFFESVVKRFNNSQLPLERLITPSGFDSDVYRFGEFVYKFYSPEIDKEKLDLYRKITNKASLTSSKENWTMDFRYSNVTFSLRVNKIMNVFYWDEKDTVVGVSRFISGRRLDELQDIIDKKEIQGTLSLSGSDINKRLGVCGVDLVPINIRFDDKDQSLIITDLCARLELLKEVGV
jgi:hypothetical protein